MGSGKRAPTEFSEHSSSFGLRHCGYRRLVFKLQVLLVLKISRPSSIICFNEKEQKKEHGNVKLGLKEYVQEDLVLEQSTAFLPAKRFRSDSGQQQQPLPRHGSDLYTPSGNPDPRGWGVPLPFLEDCGGHPTGGGAMSPCRWQEPTEGQGGAHCGTAEQTTTGHTPPCAPAHGDSDGFLEGGVPAQGEVAAAGGAGTGGCPGAPPALRPQHHAACGRPEDKRADAAAAPWAENRHVCLLRSASLSGRAVPGRPKAKSRREAAGKSQLSWRKHCKLISLFI